MVSQCRSRCIMLKRYWIIALVLAFQGHAEASSSLYTSPASLMQLLNQGEKLFLVDVRPEPDYQAFRIPGSIHIPLFLVKAKLFLKTAPVVLLDEGHFPMSLEMEAAALSRNGFAVTVLEGGLLSWKCRGGALEGDPFAMEELNRIKPETVARARGAGEFDIIYAAPDPPGNLVKRFPGEILPGIDINKAVIKRIALKPDFQRLVVITGSDQECNALYFNLKREFRDRVLFLKGGWNALGSLISNQMLASKPVSQRKMSTGPCKPCEKKQRNYR